MPKENVSELLPCINFTGGINSNGYGILSIKQKQYLAHVVAFKLSNPTKNLRPPICVCHKCDNKICINPKHLFLGTREENNRDRDNKNRTVIVYGSKNGKSKLKELDVIRIKSLLNNKLCSLAEIGRKFGVRWQTIQAISKGKSWKHL